MTTINSLITYTAYVAIGLLILIVIKTIIDLIKGNTNAWIDDIKVLINYGITLALCWSLFLSYALIVRPPIKMESSYDLTITSLNIWLIEDLTKNGLICFGIIISITFITYFIQRNFERDKSVKLTFGILFFNVLLLITTIVFTYLHTLIGLSIEVSHHFGM
ncbi:MAG: hypothetical protein NVV82_20140 [Sporocytophaga sp.]|nr:hypothetical protein [Sporocytophaga sp.]